MRKKRKPKKRLTRSQNLKQKRKKKSLLQESPSRRTQRRKVKRQSNTKLLKLRKQLFFDSYRQNKLQLNQQKTKTKTLNNRRMTKV